MNKLPLASEPIGVFDSGVGGLSILKALVADLPFENFIYVSDNAYVPYGEKPAEQIIQRALIIAEFFKQQSVKAMVMACNTATAAAAPTLREHNPDMIVVGMEPAVKPATQATQSGVIGVLATTGTLTSARFAALLDRFANHLTVLTQPCPGWVELVESGKLETPYAKALVDQAVKPLLEKGCDTLILGCTHYHFLKPLIRLSAPEPIQLIDTANAVAKQLRERLTQNKVLAPPQQNPRLAYSQNSPVLTHHIQFFTTKYSDSVAMVMRHLWQESIHVQPLSI